MTLYIGCMMPDRVLILFDVPGHLALVDFVVQKNTIH